MSLLPGATNTRNMLLFKDEEGKVKQTHYDLPPEDHPYGRKVPNDPEPISHVTNSWNYGHPSHPKLTQNNKDFREMNKLTVRSGLYTAKDQTQFRTTNVVPLKQKEGTKLIPVYLPEEEFTYGQANRPSTPMKLVMGNCYALMAEDANRMTYQSRASRSTNNEKRTTFKNTRNHDLLRQKNQRLVAFHNKPTKQDKFKLTKFTQPTVPRVQTNLQSFGLTSLKQQ